MEQQYVAGVATGMARKRAYRFGSAFTVAALLFMTAAPALAHICSHAGKSDHGRMCEEATHDMSVTPMSEHCEHAGAVTDEVPLAVSLSDTCCALMSGDSDEAYRDPAIQISITKLIVVSGHVRNANALPSATTQFAAPPRRTASTPAYRLNNVILC